MQRRHFFAALAATVAARALAKEEPVKPTRKLYALWGSAAGSVLLVGAASGAVGLILRSDDQGKTWRQPKSNTTQELYGVWGSSEKNLYIVGARGTILRSVDKGKTWEKQTSHTKRTLYGVFGVSAKEVYAVGEAGTILRTKDHGKTWEALTSNTAQSLFAITGGPKTLYTAGLKGTLLRSIDRGETWESQTTPATEKLCALSQQKASHLLMIESKSVLQSSDDGKSWRQNASAERLFGFFALSETQWFVPGADGVLYVSADQGATFRTIESGLYSNLRGVWGEGSALYAISEMGGIAYSKDAGETWAVQLKEAFQGGH